MGKKLIQGTLLAVVLAFLCAGLFGCSLKFEALYHGRTPIGVDDRKATALTAAESPVRTVKYRHEQD